MKRPRPEPGAIVDKERRRFWALMVRNVLGRTLRELDFIEHPGRKYQIFEVLVVDTLRRWSSGITWTVTPVSADAGIDFMGEREPLRLAAFGAVELTWRIVGQVKRMRAPKEELLMRALAAVRQVARTQTVSGAMFVISSDVKPESITRLLEKDTIWHEFTGAKWHIPAERFLACFAADRERIGRIVTDCYNPSEHAAIQSFLAKVPARFDPHIVAEIERPALAQAGRLIRCRLSLRSALPLPQTRFRLRYQGSPGEPNVVEIARPSRLASPAGLTVSLHGPDARRQEIWLRSFVSGPRRLGAIVVEDLDGREWTSIDLGIIDIRPFLEPPYFDVPNRPHERDLVERIDAALSGRVEIVAVTGAGGAGKSRFCQRVIDVAADSGFEWVSLGQDNTPTNGRRLLGRLLSGLTLDASDGPVVIDDVVTAIGRVVAQARSDVIASVRAYLRDDTGPVDADHIATALLVLIVQRLRDAPLLIHLHDLHWAGGEAFTILGLALDYLRRNEPSLRHGIVVIFEGRSHESLFEAETQTFRVPEEWFNFLKAGGLPILRLARWSAEECGEYLTRVLAASVDRAHPLAGAELPLHAELIAHIQQRAQGNPMHLIEQLKRLYELGIVAQHDNGLLYVRSALPAAFDTPPAIDDLIRARIDHYQRLDAELIDLLAVLARVGRRVPGALFQALTTGSSWPGRLRWLDQLDVATIARDGSATFEFAHENYFHVFQSVPILPTSRTLTAARGWYATAGTLTLPQKAELLRLISVGRGSQRQALTLILEGMRESRLAEDDFLLEEFTRRFLAADSSLQQRAGIDPLAARYELAEIMTRTGSWSDAHRELETIIRAVATRRGVEDLLHYVRARAELANVHVSLQETDAAIQAADDGLQHIEAVLSAGPERAAEAMRLREKLWHRRAVALWFDGRAVEAVVWQWRAYRSAVRRGDRSELTTVLREIGTLLLHRNPRFGNSLLRRALDIGGQLEDFHHGARLIIEAQLTMGQLLEAAGTSEAPSTMPDIRARAERVYYGCLHQLTRYEATIAALVAGAAAGYLGKLDESRRWFGAATAIAIQAGLEEEIWKARLNLAQVDVELGRREEARLHAGEARRVLVKGLQAGDRGRRAARRSLMALPLAHVARIEGVETLPPDLAAAVVALLEAWRTRPTFRDRTAQQVMHVRRTDYDYFLMN